MPRRFRLLPRIVEVIRSIKISERLVHLYGVAANRPPPEPPGNLRSPVASRYANTLDVQKCRYSKIDASDPRVVEIRCRMIGSGAGQGRSPAEYGVSRTTEISATSTVSPITLRVPARCNFCGLRTDGIGGGCGPTVRFNPIASRRVNHVPRLRSILVGLHRRCLPAIVRLAYRSDRSVRYYVRPARVGHPALPFRLATVPRNEPR